MVESCADPPCGVQGFYVVATNDAIASVAASDVACQGVTASCALFDDAGACTKYWVLPIDTGNCHVDVDLVKGTVFSADVKIARGSSGCPGFYPSLAADSTIEVP
jgi:hypothetical protein